MEGLTVVIRECIEEKGFMHVTVARELGIHRATFSRKMNGRADFTVSELDRLAQILDTTSAELMRRAEQNATINVATAGHSIKSERAGKTWV